MVAVVGGGYGGITVAKALDSVADVVLVEPRDTFVHNVAALRGVVDPAWAERLFIPYGGLLERGRVVRGRAASIEGTTVVLESGERLEADYVVIATGSTHAFPAKIEEIDSERARMRLQDAHLELAAASSVLLVGAGPVGLEFAGEIKAAWPDKRVTVTDTQTDLLSGRFPEEFRAEVRRQLDELGIEVVLGAAPSGDFDLRFACFAPAQRPGREVTPELRVVGEERVFAIGDANDVPEMKTARHAQFQAEVVAANITAMIEGRADLAAYAPSPDAIVLPLGPKAGVSYAPEVGVLGVEATVDIKGTLFVEMYEELLGLVTA
ncbi:FAD-dependent oxidoreductase [Nonomuraea sp. NPDC050556]|uniref:FAD-dependent oxidoreductase n=1 Tax=Nonomuraea sp. NPDC050556 TaxID=3364369 RepID=UPI0037BDE5B4